MSINFTFIIVISLILLIMYMAWIAMRVRHHNVIHNRLYLFLLTILLVIIACAGYNSEKPNSNKIHRYESLSKYYSNNIKSDKFCSHRDNYMLHEIHSHKLLHKKGIKFLILSKYNNKFLIYRTNHKLIPKISARSLLYCKGDNISFYPFGSIYDLYLPLCNQNNSKYNAEGFVLNFNSPYKYSFCINNISFDYYEKYVVKTNSLKYLRSEKKYIKYIIPILETKRRLVNKKFREAHGTYLARYTNICNFKIFIYLLIDLILLSLVSVIFVLLKPCIELSPHSHIYKYNFKNTLIKSIDCCSDGILNNYIFRIIPLVIAIMSGVIVVYIKLPTHGIFVFLVKYTIPILSCLQFIRSSNRIFNTLIEIFKKY